jgi:hypothetical protein
MPRDYLHNHADFAGLIRIVAGEKSIDPALVEKDYWIMQCLYGLQKLGFEFELKGGTSLSKGFRIIDRFSEDIDIQIHPPPGRNAKTGRNQNKPAHIQSRKEFYDWLATNIRIDGIVSVERDAEFDDDLYRSGGIRLHYANTTDRVPGLKDGVLLEAGFDTVAPNHPKTIGSWAYEYAATKVGIIDNRTVDVACYDPGHTLVEKLQTISTKYRKQQEAEAFPINFMRHYYDVYQLLQQPEVQDFIATPAYAEHKKNRFRAGDNPDISGNEAFRLSDSGIRAEYEKAYNRSSGLYYRDKPGFDQILALIAQWADRL